ncbi:MAG TPA: phosphatidylserine/phosphatidylglycerophosphate/cardiolipin synthase family protein [Gemmatimonadaceae bacterium]
MSKSHATVENERNAPVDAEYHLTSAVPFVRTSAYPVRAGNVVRPFVDGTPAFRRICEAIEAAEHSVWLTVAFMWSSFEMPDGRGSALDVLDRAASRGIDVRILFWRPDIPIAGHARNAFWGSVEQRALLDRRRSGLKIRWDRAHPGFCQHQKTWLIDVGGEEETAFVGGINLNPNSMAFPGHGREREHHDVYVEVRGPSTVDVHHNFVQRWNEASERGERDGRWGQGSENDLPFPMRVPKPCGAAIVQIQRTIHAGRYANGRSAPGAEPFDIAQGERSILDQYCVAIDAARRSIYIENQYLDVPEIIARLHDALTRDIEVVVLVPAEPDGASFASERAALERHPNFTLAGVAGRGGDGARNVVYVHDKLMIVDDVWATVGSCNLHRYSVFGNSELNVAFSDSAARALRSELLLEHLGIDTSGMDDRSSLRLFRRIALENRARLDAGDTNWQGIAFHLDAATYGGGL